MRVRLLPSHVRQPQESQTLSTFLVNGATALDGGSIGLVVPHQPLIEELVLTHEHLDHIATLPLYLSEIVEDLSRPFCIHATASTIDSLTRHLFNGRLWPRFQEIPLPGGSGPILEFSLIEEEEPFTVRGVQFTAIPVDHTVPTVGLIMEEAGQVVIYTSDTGPTDRIWELARARSELRAVVVDVSYPSEMVDLSRDALHLTPRDLHDQLARIDPGPEVRILVHHLKPRYRDQILQELAALGDSRIEVMRIDHDYVW